MIYGIKITPTETGVEVTCRDIPECVYDAKDRAEAIALAGQMLPGALVMFYRKKKRPFPLPTKYQKGEVLVDVSAKIQAKMLFWNFLRENNIRLVDVARKLGVSRSEAGRLVDLTQDGASIDAVEKALKQFGKYFTLTIS